MRSISRYQLSGLAATLCVAALLRFWYSIDLPGTGHDLLHSDMGMYDRAAWQMAQQLPVEGEPGFNGYHPLSASTYIYPGFVYFVAGIYAGFGHSPFAVRIAQALIGTVSVWLVYVIGSTVFGRRAGLLAAFVTAVYLPLAYYGGYILSETWFLFLQLAAIAVWLAAWACRSSDCLVTSPASPPNAPPGEQGAGRSSLVLAVIAGLLAGFACITRTAFVPAVASIAVTSYWLPPRELPRRRRRQLVAGFLVGSALAIAPITLRNYQIHGRFILVSTNGPSTFFVGHVLHTAFIPPEHSKPNDVAMADMHRQINWMFLKRQWPRYLAEIPDYFASMWLSDEFWPQTMVFWKYDTVEGNEYPSRLRGAIDEPNGPPVARVDFFPDLVKFSDRIVWLLFGLPFGVWAVFVLRCGSWRPVVLYAAIIPYLIIPFIAPGFARYRIPAVPLFFILAAHALLAYLDRREPRTSNAHTTARPLDQN